MIVEALVCFDLNAFKLVVHDEVDHAGNRVGAVNRASTTGQDFHALDQRRGNLVQVGRVGTAVRAAWWQAATVDEYQGTN